MGLYEILVFVVHFVKYFHVCLFSLLTGVWDSTPQLQTLMMEVNILREQRHLYFWLHRLGGSHILPFHFLKYLREPGPKSEGSMLRSAHPLPVGNGGKHLPA